MGDLHRKLVESGLCRKGFRRSHKDHRKLVYYAGGKKTSVWTFCSHGHNTISEDNLRKMARQCSLPLAQSLDLIGCPLSREEYRRILISTGRITI